MPEKAPSFKRPRCPAPLLRPRDEHGKELQQDGRTTAAERGYGYRWQQTRVGYIVKHPLCCCCLANGHTAATEVVDHIVPHRGDKKLFWDRTNWQGLCAWCHDNIKAVIEARWAEGKAGDDELRLDRLLPEFFG